MLQNFVQLIDTTLNSGLNTLIKRIFPIIVLFLILAVVYSTNQNKSAILYENQCYLTSTTCHLMLSDTEVVIEFSDFPLQVEEMSSVVITHASHFSLVQGWLEGTNMFMGRTTLFVTDTQSLEKTTENRGELFLGACSEPNMRWKLLLDLKDSRTGQTDTISIFFQTSLQSS